MFVCLCEVCVLERVRSRARALRDYVNERNFTIFRETVIFWANEKTEKQVVVFFQRETAFDIKRVKWMVAESGDDRLCVPFMQTA